MQSYKKHTISKDDDKAIPFRNTFLFPDPSGRVPVEESFGSIGVTDLPKDACGLRPMAPGSLGHGSNKTKKQYTDDFLQTPSGTKKDNVLLTISPQLHGVAMTDNNEGWILQTERKKRSTSITEETENIIEDSEVENIIDYKNRYLHVFCMNCGKKGHLTKKCNYPIISLGIVTLYIEDISISFNMILNMCKRIQHQYLFENDEIRELKKIYESLKNLTGNQLDQNIHYLMIRRRNSLSYVDFIRGKYDLDDYEYIYNTLLMMTKEEQEDLISKTFEELWSELWTTPIESIHYNHEFLESKHKFQKLKEGYMIQKCEIQFPLSMKKIFETSCILYEEAEWGFPKGRRNIHEKNIECAKREFQEETGLEESEYQIINISPLEEIYLGSNHIRYKHIYYFSQMMEKKNMEVDKKNTHQKSEVGDIRWVTFEEGFNLIRDYHKEKRNILFNTHQFIKNLILHFCSLYQDFYQKNKSIFL